jgi:hypothetical protein
LDLKSFYVGAMGYSKDKTVARQMSEQLHSSKSLITMRATTFSFT